MRRLPLLEKEVTDVKPIDPALEQLDLEFWLSKIREYLTADASETKVMLGKDSPEDLARQLAASRLIDPAYRKQLWDGGEAAIAASDDPLISYVLRTDPTARVLRKEVDDRVAAPIQGAQARIAKARFAIYGASIYPDATFTLRLSYGRSTAGRSTTVRPAVHLLRGSTSAPPGKPPFQLTQRWIEAQPKLNPDTVFDISNSTDIIGGNSGSPMINGRGEVIGAVFDGNIYRSAAPSLTTRSEPGRRRVDRLDHRSAEEGLRRPAAGARTGGSVILSLSGTDSRPA